MWHDTSVYDVHLLFTWDHNSVYDVTIFRIMEHNSVYVSAGLKHRLQVIQQRDSTSWAGKGERGAREEMCQAI